MGVARFLVLALLLNAGVAALHIADSSELTVTKAQPVDSVVVIADDIYETYAPEQVEASSNDPFCLSIVAAEEVAKPPVTIWKECVTAGRMLRSADDFKTHAVFYGGKGHTLSLVLSNPITASNTDLKVLVRFVVKSTYAYVLPGASK